MRMTEQIPEIPRRLEAFTNAYNSDETDLYLYGYVVSGKWKNDKGCISSEDVREALQDITAKIINVHINSGGGSAFDGISIHNLLKQHSATVNVYIDGLAASAASVIAMAADKIFMPSNTMLMIHKASAMVYGNEDDLQQELEALRKLDTAVFNNYKSRFTGTDDELRELIKKETFLTAEECFTLGFCDEVLAEKKEEPKKPEVQLITKEQLIAKYQKELKKSEPTKSIEPTFNFADGVTAFFNGLSKGGQR